MPVASQLSTVKRTLWPAALLVGLAVAAYGAFLYRYALNIPFGDDIMDVLWTLSDILEVEGIYEVFTTLFKQSNDHRTLSSRLVYLVVYQLYGEINFRGLVFLANLALPLLLWLLYLPLRRSGASDLVIVPAALLLFQLRAYGITLWSMAAFAYFYVYLYGFACLYCLHKVNGKRFSLAILFATLSTFSLASGQLIWLIGFASLLHQCLLLRKASLWYLSVWLLMTAAVLVAWRIGLETPNTAGAVLEHFFSTPLKHISYYLILLGNVVSGQQLVAAGLTGALLLLLLVLSSIRHFRQEDLRLELCAWFIALSVMAMVLGRAYFTPLEYALSSRYSFPSILLTATVWVMLASRLSLQDVRMLALTILLSSVYCINSYRIYSAELQPQLERRVKQFNSSVFWQFGTSLPESNAMVARAVELEIWRPPDRPHPLPKLAISGSGKPDLSREKKR